MRASMGAVSDRDTPTVIGAPTRHPGPYVAVIRNPESGILDFQPTTNKTNNQT